MRANQVRTLIISHDDLVDVQAALDLLRAGKGLSAEESGTVEYEEIANVEVAMPWRATFDGFKWTVFVFVSSG